MYAFALHPLKDPPTPRGCGASSKEIPRHAPADITIELLAMTGAEGTLFVPEPDTGP